MVCSNCGYALGPEDQFCGGCGAYLTDAPASEPSEAGSPRAPGVAPDAWADAYESGQESAPRSRSTGIIAGVLIGLLLGGVLIYWLANRGGDEDVAGGEAPTTPVATVTDGEETPGEEPTTPEETPEPTPSEIELPGSAAECDDVGGMTVHRGNDQTSCQFAENVARAYAGLDQPVTAEVTLEDVESPVTGQTYNLDCDHSTPVRCTGGNNAVIFLTLPS